MKSILSHCFFAAMALSVFLNFLFIEQTKRLTEQNDQLSAALHVASEAYLKLLIQDMPDPAPLPFRPNAKRQFPIPTTSTTSCSVTSVTDRVIRNDHETHREPLLLRIATDR
jgi:hypothetical protein